MRIFFLKITICFLLALPIFAQVGLDNSLNKLPLKNENLFAPSSTNESSIDLLKEKKTPLIPLEEDNKGVDFEGKNKYRDSKEYFKDQYKYPEEGPGVSLDAFRRNQYLGDMITNMDMVQVVCRDYSYVDGDIIKIYH